MPRMPKKAAAKKPSAPDEAFLSTAVTRMRATRNEWKKSSEKPELSPRVTQAILALIGVMPSKSELRYSTATGFDFKVTSGRRYKAMSPLDYAFQLIDGGTNPSNSAWGAEIHSLADKADREALFVRKMRGLLGKCNGFKDIYAALKTIIPEAEWAGALDWPEAVTESEGSSGEDSPDEPHHQVVSALPDEPTEGVASDLPDEQTKLQADDHEERGSAKSQSESSEEESEANVSSSSGDSSTGSDDPSSDDEAPLDRRRRRALARAGASDPAPDAESPGESWLTAIADRVKAARDRGHAQLLQDFLEKQVPQTAAGLQTSRRVERPTKAVPALRPTCAFATEIITARLAEPPAGARRFLCGGDLARVLNPQQRQIVCESLALIESGVTLGRVLIGAGVGVGKTSAALALCCALFRGAVQKTFVSSAVVFAPGHLVSQWAYECQQTLHRAEVFTIPQESALNMRSLVEVFKPFYQAAYEATRRPGERISMPIMVLPIHIFNFPNLVSFLHTIRETCAPAMVFDEPHLTCKRNDGACGSEVADLMQHTAAHGVMSVGIYVTATPLCKKGEALPWLMSMGLVTALPHEVFQADKDAAAQCVLDAMTIKPQSDEISAVPRYSLYFVETRLPVSVDRTRAPSQVARQLRAGNGTKLSDNHVLHAALLAALYAQSAGESSLIFFDVKKGVQELRATVQWPSFYFLEGDTPASEREKVMRAMMEDPGAVVLVSTIALCGVGTNLGGRINLVIHCGTAVFDSETLRQNIGRAARPPSQKAVTSIMFMPPDVYSRCTERLRKAKQLQVAPFSGTEVTTEAAQDCDERAGCALLDMGDLASLVAGLHALTQDGLVLKVKRKCFILSDESQLQPPTSSKKLRTELEKIQASVRQAIADQADPAAASARRAEARRRLLESLAPPQADPQPAQADPQPAQADPLPAQADPLPAQADSPPIQDSLQFPPSDTELSLSQLEQDAVDAEADLERCRQLKERLEQARIVLEAQQQLELLEQNAAQSAADTAVNPFEDHFYASLAPLAPAPH